MKIVFLEIVVTTYYLAAEFVWLEWLNFYVNNYVEICHKKKCIN